MKPLPSPPRAGYLAISSLILLLVISCGCTQQSGGKTDIHSGIKISQPDDSHITVAFIGDPGTEGLLEMEVTITGSAGKNFTLSTGSRLKEMPLPTMSTISFTGPFSGKDHVVVTGHFPNQSSRILADTII